MHIPASCERCTRYLIANGLMMLIGGLLAQVGYAQAHHDAQLSLKHGAVSLVSIDDEAFGKTAQQRNVAFKVYAQAAQFQEDAYLILQFDAILSPETVNGLNARGIELQHYIPPHAYFAQVPIATNITTLTEAGLVGYYRPEASNKMSPFYLKAVHAQPEAHYLIRGSVASHIDETVLEEILASMGHATTVQFDARHRLFIAELRGTAVLDVAELPFITAIEAYHDAFELDEHSTEDPYRESSLADVAVSLIRANYVKSTRGLDGEGVVMGVGDNVYQGRTHIDLLGRHTVIDPQQSNNGSSNDHSVHTTGIAGGGGVRNPRFEGVANRATLYSAVSGNIFSLGLDAVDPMVISSNSWNTSDPNFGQVEGTGRYNLNSQFIDQLLHENPALLSLHSAGNFGQEPPGYPDSYLTLNPSYGAAKNALVVGRYSFPKEFRVAASYGPARDGRIKPDVVAANSVHATTVTNTYGIKQGSSQSTPAVAGVAALLYQQYRQQHAGETPEGGLIKTILLNTSDYIAEQGPTFASGFGRVNARRAAQVVANEQHHTVELDHAEEQSLSIPVPSEVDGKPIAQLKVMLYWTDPEASPYAQPALVNNLDLRVSDGTTSHLPWVLDTTAVNLPLPATRGDDALNNVEQVAIDNPAAGTYQAQITGTVIPFGPQRAHLVYSYVLDEVVITYPMGGEKLFAGQHKVVFWDTDGVGENSVVDDAAYSLDGGTSWVSFNSNGRTPQAAEELIIPEAPLSEMLVRVERSGQASTSSPVVISEPLALSLSPVGIDQAQFVWNSVEGADRYDILRWEDRRIWEVFATTADTSIVLGSGDFGDRTAWVSVQAVDSATGVRSQRAVAHHFVASNAAPVAVQDRFTKPANNNRFFIDVLANDTDADRDPLYITELEPGTQGTASIWDDQTLMYRPNSDFSGRDTLVYTITDYHGGTAEGQVIITSGSSIATTSTTPRQFTLFQNYPNPFNPITTIQYEIPNHAPVTLHLFDMIGRRVRVLVDQDQTAGTYHVQLDATTLASGMYVYRLTAGDFAASKRLVLVK